VAGTATFQIVANGSSYYPISIPANVNQITATVFGASGGDLAACYRGSQKSCSGVMGIGGNGGCISGIFNVTADSTLYAVIGEVGVSVEGCFGGLGGRNGGRDGKLIGAGGGGATDIRTLLNDSSTRY